MNPLMLAQCTAIGESLPAVPAAIRTFSRMNAHMNLLRATRAEGLAALVARKQFPRRGCAMRMTMIGKGAPIGKLFVAHLAHHRLVAMRSHVALQAGFVVKILTTLWARMTLLTRMIPGVFDQGFAIATLLAAQHAWVWLKLVWVASVQMAFDGLFLVEADTTQDTPASRKTLFYILLHILLYDILEWWKACVDLRVGK